MSLIAKALKKAAESRQVPERPEPKAESIVYLAEKLQPWPRTAVLVLVALALAAVSVSIWAIMATVKNSQLSRNEVIHLERSIKAEEKRINELTADVRRGQKSADARIRNLKSRLNQGARDLNDRIVDLSSRETVHYGSLKQALLDDRQQMAALDQSVISLDQHTKSLDQKIQGLTSALEPQVNGTANPAGGN